MNMLLHNAQVAAAALGGAALVYRATRRLDGRHTPVQAERAAVLAATGIDVFGPWRPLYSPASLRPYNWAADNRSGLVDLPRWSA